MGLVGRGSSNCRSGAEAAEKLAGKEGSTYGFQLEKERAMGAADASVFSAALAYAELGFRVLPVVKGQKRALIPNWPQAATTDPAVLREWFDKRYRRANLAIVAEGLVVLDLDAGFDRAFITTERAAAIKSIAPPVQRTPRGGFHVFFRRPEKANWRCSTGKLAASVDVKTNGGYVLVSPSQTECGRYQWVRPLVPKNKLPLPPEWLVNELDRLSDPPKTNQTFCQQSNDPIWGRSWVPKRIRELGPVGVGARHSTLLSCLAAYRAAGADDDEIEAMAQRINFYLLRPPLDDSECQRIVRWICTKPRGRKGLSWTE